MKNRCSNANLSNQKRGQGKPVLFFGGDGGSYLAALAFDVTSLEPYMSCGLHVDKAQGYALGSLAPNPLL